MCAIIDTEGGSRPDTWVGRDGEDRMSVADAPENLDLVLDETEEEQSDERTRRILAFIFLVAIIAFIIWWFLSRLTTVPDVVGLEEYKARDTIEAAGFAVGEVTTTTAAVEEEDGKVADQDPDAGNRVLRGSAIDLVVAVLPGREGPGGFGYGDVDTGLEFPSSREATDQAVDYVPHDVSPPLSGPQVPFVLNMTESQAKSTLRSGGYRMKVQYGPSTAGVAKGRVYYQKPEPDAFEDYGTMVNIWVSTGAPQGGYPYPQPD